MLPYIGIVPDTTLSCLQLKLLCWLARRELKKSIHFHPDRVRTLRRRQCTRHDSVVCSTEPFLLVTHPEPITVITFHPDQTITWRHRACRTSVPVVDIGRICLGIRTQNGAEISICGIEIFCVWITFDLLQITAGCKP